MITVRLPPAGRAAPGANSGTVRVLPIARVAGTFEPATDHGGSDAADGRGARYLQWEWDPDPDDTCTLTEYAFLLRGTGRPVQVVHETRRLGLFSRDTWLRLLASAGFEPGSTIEVTTENRPPRELFTGHRRRSPVAPPG